MYYFKTSCWNRNVQSSDTHTLLQRTRPETGSESFEKTETVTVRVTGSESFEKTWNGTTVTCRTGWEVSLKLTSTSISRRWDKWVVSTVKYPERQTHQFRTQAALPTRLVLLVEQFEQVLVVTDTKLSSESRWESAKRGCNRLWLWSRSQPICRTRVKDWNFWRLSKGFARKQSSETCFSWKTERRHSLLTV